MKTPPLLIGAVLVFWGWQTGLLIPGAIMAVLLEGSRLVKTRWDLSDNDFARIWTFCSLLVFGATVYAFSNSSGPETFRGLFENPNMSTEQNAGNTSIQTGLSLIRWLPMLFFLFAAAQVYSTRQEIPLYVISLILQRRWKKAKRLGQSPPSRGADVCWPYFAVVLLAASIHPYENNSYFWGSSALLLWALWRCRSRRVSVATWAATLLVVIASGYASQRGIVQLQQYLGSMNSQWLANLLMSRRHTDPTQSRTQIGQIGRIKNSPRIVIRLWPQAGEPPSYLREASYQVFKRQTWFAPERTNNFQVVLSEKDETTWKLLPGKTNTARVHIACYLDGRTQAGNASGLLPLPTGARRLENFPAYILQTNNLGVVMAEGRGLEQFDALYGPGDTIDSGPDAADGSRADEARAMLERVGRDNWADFVRSNGTETTPPETNLDLHVSLWQVPALESVISEMHLRGKTRDETMLTINQFFADKFTYRMWQGPGRPESNETPLGQFLLRTRAGHCEYFATAAVLILREIGIPARYAIGYMVHEKSGNEYVIRQRDAHAWCIVWNEKTKTWDDYDVTPASWVEEESKNSSAVWLSDTWSWLKFQIAKLRWGQTHLRQYILIGMIPVLGLLLFQIIRHQRRKNLGATRGGKKSITWPGVDSEFYEIEKQLTRRGIPQRANEPLTDWLERAASSPELAEFETPLRELLRMHYQYRFDPNGLSAAQRDELRCRSRDLLAQFEQRTGVRPSSTAATRS